MNNVFYIQTVLGPLYMSPVDRAGLVSGMNFALGSLWEFQPGFWDEKWPKILGTSSGTNSRNKANMAKHSNNNHNFLAYHSFGNSLNCIAPVKWDAHDVENTAGNAKRCILDRQSSCSCHHGNWGEVSTWQNFQPTYYQDPSWKNLDLGNRTSPPSHMNTFLQRI